jgi:hypothetical protein
MELVDIADAVPDPPANVSLIALDQNNAAPIARNRRDDLDESSVKSSTRV